MIPILRRAMWLVFIIVLFYVALLLSLPNETFHRHLIYLHAVKGPSWFYDLNKPEYWGFAKNQITPFNFTTPDNELLYAWHVLPIGLYAKHETAILNEPSGIAEDITKTKAFELLSEDPEARLIIYFHGNVGCVAQGYRPDIYRTFADGDSSRFHILTVDYRGYGYSSGFPTEEGLIIDGVATVNWALQVAKLPPERIILVGHSLGTGVASAVAENFAQYGTEFAGLILTAPFGDIASLLIDYYIAGWFPILGPLKRFPAMQKYLTDKYLNDTWHTTNRLISLVRISKRLRLFFVHARNDIEIAWTNSERLFEATANATTPDGMDSSLLAKMKARNTIDMGDGAFTSTWKASPQKIIKEVIVSSGGHNMITTYPLVPLAVLQAFELDDEPFSSREL